MMINKTSYQSGCIAVFIAFVCACSSQPSSQYKKLAVTEIAQPQLSALNGSWRVNRISSSPSPSFEIKQITFKLAQVIKRESKTAYPLVYLLNGNSICGTLSGNVVEQSPNQITFNVQSKVNGCWNGLAVEADLNNALSDVRSYQYKKNTLHLISDKGLTLIEAIRYQ